MTCELCDADSPQYQLTRVCCCVRLILQQPNRERRNAILHAIARRPEYARAETVKELVEEAFKCGKKKL